MELSTHPHQKIKNWLYFTAAMVFAMAIIGAITRLTESGLSMVEWKPFIGAIPPLNAAEWDRVFNLYKQTPEFIHKNSWMGLDDFKTIFFWEWFHRLWGRLIGLVYALPLAWFWLRGQIPSGYKLKFLGLLFLGGLQGFMGWFMVMSGLVDEPSVSHFRLAAHLMLAMTIFCLLLWLAFDFERDPKQSFAPSSLKSLKLYGWGAFAVLGITIAWGAFTAGLDAGMLYNTWPKMDAHWMPPEVTGALSLIHDPGAVQFFHRWIAIVAFIAVFSFGWKLKNFPLMGMILLQVCLGIATVLSQVYIPLAALHQAGALVLLALMIRQMHTLHKLSKVSALSSKSR